MKKYKYRQKMVEDSPHFRLDNRINEKIDKLPAGALLDKVWAVRNGWTGLIFRWEVDSPEDPPKARADRSI